jgi:hypothetical protein
MSSATSAAAERSALRAVYETFAGEVETADLADARAALEDGCKRPRRRL